MKFLKMHASYYYIRLYIERLLENLNTPIRYWISHTFLNLFICLTIKCTYNNVDLSNFFIKIISTWPTTIKYILMTMCTCALNL